MHEEGRGTYRDVCEEQQKHREREREKRWFYHAPPSIPDRPQLVQETIFSGLECFRLQLLSPKQKSQYGLGLASSLPSTLGGGGRITGTLSSGFLGGDMMVTEREVLGVERREGTPRLGGAGDPLLVGSPPWYCVRCALRDATVL